MSVWNILYVGGSYPQKIALVHLEEAGFKIILTDINPNPPGSPFASRVFLADATDHKEIERIANRVLKDSNELITYGIADYACGSCAHVNESLKLNGQLPSATRAMIDKVETKMLLRSNDVPVPLSIWSGNQNDFSLSIYQEIILNTSPNTQVIVKPSNSNASQGTFQCSLSHYEVLCENIQNASQFSETVAIEEFYSGEIRNIDLLVADGKVDLISMTRRIDDQLLPFLPSAQIQEPLSNIEEAADLKALAFKIAEAFDFAPGPMTVDYIQSPSGPVILEVSPHFHLISLELHRGNGNPQLAWFDYLRNKPDWRKNLQPSCEQAGIFLMIRAGEIGIVDGVQQEKELLKHPMLKDYFRLKEDGSQIRDLSGRGGLVSIAWLVAPTVAELEYVINQQFYDIRPTIKDISVGQ